MTASSSATFYDLDYYYDYPGLEEGLAKKKMATARMDDISGEDWVLAEGLGSNKLQKRRQMAALKRRKLMKDKLQGKSVVMDERFDDGFLDFDQFDTGLQDKKAGGLGGRDRPDHGRNKLILAIFPFLCSLFLCHNTYRIKLDTIKTKMEMNN